MNFKIKNITAPFLNSKKLRVFLFFLVLTGVIWFLKEMSKTYTSTVTYNVNYTNLPDHKILAKPPQERIEALVTTTGFLLWKQKLKAKKISVDLKKVIYKNNKAYVLPNTQIKKVNKIQKGKVKIDKFTTDTIFISLVNKISKKVPVKVNLHLNYKIGYSLNENILVTPDSITIQGPEKIINTIFEVATHERELKNISKDIEEEIYLINKQQDSVVYSNNTVKITGKVEKFTEDTKEIPLQIINSLKNKINVFPKEVTVTYTVAVSKFSTLKKDDFKVVVDYNEFKKDSSLTYLTPQIIHKPTGVKRVKITPQKINFLIQK